MKSLLVAVDETPGAEAAAGFAIALAKAHGAALMGAGVLDVAYLTAPEPGTIGGAHYKFEADVARLAHAHDRNTRLLRAFAERCKSEGVKANVVVREGAPSEELTGAAARHDAIVIGHDSELHGEPSVGLASTVAQILKHNPRPLLVTPGKAKDPSRIVVAYDGSAPAARSLQLFALLDLARGARVDALSIDAKRNLAERAAEQAADYLKLYGKQHAIASKADPAEIILAETASLEAGLLVMGAYGRNGWREYLLGSCTKRLASECPTTLFLHH